MDRGSRAYGIWISPLSFPFLSLYLYLMCDRRGARVYNIQFRFFIYLYRLLLGHIMPSHIRHDSSYFNYRNFQSPRIYRENLSACILRHIESTVSLSLLFLYLKEFFFIPVLMKKFLKNSILRVCVTIDYQLILRNQM